MDNFYICKSYCGAIQKVSIVRQLVCVCDCVCVCTLSMPLLSWTLSMLLLSWTCLGKSFMSLCLFPHHKIEKKKQSAKFTVLVPWWNEVMYESTLDTTWHIVSAMMMKMTMMIQMRNPFGSSETANSPNNCVLPSKSWRLRSLV